MESQSIDPVNWIECPRCGLINPPNTQHCNCGYDFIKKTLVRKSTDISVQPVPSQVNRGSSFLVFLGVLLFVGGIAWAIYYYAYFDTSVAVEGIEFMGEKFGGGRVNNIGLMQERQNNLIIGIAMAAFGFICIIIGQYIPHNKN